MSSNPFFSICIPSYNCARYIEECIGSISSQTFSDWEIVIVDDGSADETSLLCLNHALCTEDKMRYYPLEHEGPLSTRIRLLNRAKGNVVITLDADDKLIDPHALELIHAAFMEYDCDIVMFNATRDTDSFNLFVDYASVFGCAEGCVNYESVQRGFCLSYALNSVAFKAFKREKMTVPEDYSCFQMAEDRLQSLWLISECESAYLINRPFYYYRPNQASITRSPFKIDLFVDQLSVEHRIDEFARQLGISEDERISFKIDMVFGALISIRETVGNGGGRISLYESLLKLPEVINLRKDENRYSARMDKRLTLNSLFSRRFSTVDLLLTCRLVLQSINKLKP